MATFKEVADIQTKDILNLPTPKVNYHTVVTKPSEMQREMIAGLAERAEAIRNREVDPHSDNMLVITNDGRKIALDQRIINPLLPDHEGSKVNACAENVYRIWEETKDRRLTQLVFSDLSTPKSEQRDKVNAANGGREDGLGNAAPDSASPSVFTDVYHDLKEKLIAKGIPPEEIAFMHDARCEE